MAHGDGVRIVRRYAALATLFLVPVLAAPVIGWVTLRNFAFLAVQRQALDGSGRGWAVGLRQASQLPTAERVVGSAGPSAEPSQLALGPIPAESLLTWIGDCGIRRVQARRAIGGADWATARALLEGVVGDCPGDTFARLELGLVYDHLQLVPQVIEALDVDGVSALAPELLAANYLALARGCGPQAESAGRSRCMAWLRRAAELAPAHVAISTHLAHLTGSPLSESDLAPDRYRLSWHDPRLNALVDQAYVEWALDHPQTALPLLQDVGRELARQGAYRRSFDVYRTLQTLSPGDPWASYYVGLGAAAGGDWDAAREAFSRAHELVPSEARFITAVARADARLANATAASQGYHQALAAEPCIPEALDYLTIHGEPSTSESGDLDELVADCRRKLTFKYEAETLLVRAADVESESLADGGTVRVGNSGYIIHGPYQHLPAGQYRATFRLRVPRPLAPDCLRLDVTAETDRVYGTWFTALPVKWVKPEEVPLNRYLEVDLSFRSPGAGGFEYRVFEACGADVAVDWVDVAPLGLSAPSR